MIKKGLKAEKHFTIKNMKIKSALFLSIIAALSAIGQEPKLTLHDLIRGGKNNHRFVPENMKQLQWCGDKYIYMKGDSLMAAHPLDKKEKVALTYQQLKNDLAEANLPEIKKMPLFVVPDKNRPVFAFQYMNNRVHFDLATQQITASYVLDKKGERWEYNSETEKIAYTKENNIYIISPDGETEKVTNETGANIVCGTSVHQREFGIHKGLFWSPRGSSLAFYRMDESMVTDYPIVNMNKRIAEVAPLKYPMAGMKSHEVTVGIYRLSDKRTVWLKTGTPKEKYLTNIAWSPDEKDIYIAELNRGQDTCRLIRYNADTGKKEMELFMETHERYVEPLTPIMFLPGNNNLFIWQSQRDGYNHIYLYNTEGERLKQLTKGEWIVKKVLGFDDKGMHLFFTATASRNTRSTNGNPLEVYARKLDMKTGKHTCITNKPGVHSVSLNASCDYLIDRVASPEIPRDIDILRVIDGRKVKSLLSASSPFEGYEMPEIKTGTITAADNRTKLCYRLITPPDMDKDRKHPAIVYVYGGPHAQLITGGWMNGTRGWDLYMAKKGYVILTVDGRGSANRGFDFESVIHSRLGEAEMADQMKGIGFLKSLPYVDQTRIGIHGWSYGGFMTTNLMLTYPEVFKVGVAGGPVMDWHRYEIMYGERYMDHPEENVKGYKQSNLLHKAKNLKGRLLLIHGDVDPVVMQQHSLLFIKACVDAGTFPDYFVYPGHTHNVRGKDRPHLYEKITKYFEDFL